MPKPKVISLFKTERFENRFLNTKIIGKSVDLFVECKSCDIEIPVNSKLEKELDIFEETILRMIMLKKCSIDELSDILCLKKDLVNFIIIRLYESGLLSDNQSVSEKGKAVLLAQSELRSEVEYVQGKIFIIKKTGTVLPYIHIGEFQSESVDESDGSSITIGFGSAGNYQKVYGKKIRNTDFEKRSGSLDSRTIKRTIRTFNKIAANHHISEINMCEGYGLTSSSGENIFFHLQAAIQEGNIDEVIFSDGFVSNVDGLFEYIEKEAPHILTYVKSHAISINAHEETETRKDEIYTKYNEIHQFFKEALSHMPDINYEMANIDERKLINEGKKQIIIDCYHILEWCFYYYSVMNPLSVEMMTLIENRPRIKNGETFIDFAKSIGLRDVEKHQNLFMHLDGQRVNSVYKYKSPQLCVCFPIVVAEAKENSNSRFHQVINDNGSLLKLISELNSSGNLRHDVDADAIGVDVVEMFRQVKKIVVTLLPDYEDNEVNNVSRMTDVSQSRLLGQVLLEKALGTVFYSAMCKGLKNEWLKISPDKSGIYLPGLREYVEILYRILQSELSEANTEFDKKVKISQAEALDIIRSRFSKKVPKSFTKVNERYYINAINGHSSTLGAEAIVYYANVEDKAVDILNSLDYVEVLDKIISLRGHSDVIPLNENEESINKLRDKVIILSRAIGGYYD